MRYILHHTRFRNGAVGKVVLRLAGDTKRAEVECIGYTIDKRSVECQVINDPRRQLTVMRGVRVDRYVPVGSLPIITYVFRRSDVLYHVSHK